MIKFSILLRKRTGMNHEEFVQYHKVSHAPLFTSLPEVQQYERKYVQCHGIAVSLPGLPQPYYDGITELWFDDTEAIGKVFGSADYMQTIRPDEEKFLNLHECGFLVSMENPVM